MGGVGGEVRRRGLGYRLVGGWGEALGGGKCTFFQVCF